jgi:hypothetical protein
MASPPRARTRWAKRSDESLLDLRLCDLGVSVEDGVLGQNVARLQGELELAGLRFRPYVWLSTDWFTPDGVTGFGVPFFLAHPRLARLERKQMFEVEGGTREWCMKLLRHETAHALDNAYRLRRRRAWREHFGSASEPYRRSYVPNPNSRKFVINVDNFYAQSHPVEDFAETFAVWLRPGGRWRHRYASWPAALRKLSFVETLIREIRDVKPPVRTRERTDSLPTIRFTLREYYARKKSIWGEEDLTIYDRDLLRLFSDAARNRRHRRAAAFLRSHRSELRGRVANWTGQFAFVVDEVLKGMIARAQALRLHLARPQREVLRDAIVMLTVHTMRQVRRRHREYFR